MYSQAYDKHWFDLTWLDFSQLLVVKVGVDLLFGPTMCHRQQLHAPQQPHQQYWQQLQRLQRLCLSPSAGLWSRQVNSGRAVLWKLPPSLTPSDLLFYSDITMYIVLQWCMYVRIHMKGLLSLFLSLTLNNRRGDETISYNNRPRVDTQYLHIYFNMIDPSC